MQLPEQFAPSPEEIAEVQQANLPKRVRRAFLLHWLDGLSQSEIAERLAISLATVERDLHRAYLHCLTDLEPL